MRYKIHGILNRNQKRDHRAVLGFAHLEPVTPVVFFKLVVVSLPQSRNKKMRMAGKRLPIYRNEHKQMRRNCYQQGRMEDHSIQRRVRQGTAVR